MAAIRQVAAGQAQLPGAHLARIVPVERGESWHLRQAAIVEIAAIAQGAQPLHAHIRIAGTTGRHPVQARRQQRPGYQRYILAVIRIIVEAGIDLLRLAADAPVAVQVHARLEHHAIAPGRFQVARITLLAQALIEDDLVAQVFAEHAQRDAAGRIAPGRAYLALLAQLASQRAVAGAGIAIIIDTVAARRLGIDAQQRRKVITGLNIPGILVFPIAATRRQVSRVQVILLMAQAKQQARRMRPAKRQLFAQQHGARMLAPDYLIGFVRRHTARAALPLHQVDSQFGIGGGAAPLAIMAHARRDLPLAAVIGRDIAAVVAHVAGRRVFFTLRHFQAQVDIADIALHESAGALDVVRIQVVRALAQCRDAGKQAGRRRVAGILVDAVGAETKTAMLYLPFGATAEAVLAEVAAVAVIAIALLFQRGVERQAIAVARQGKPVVALVELARLAKQFAMRGARRWLARDHRDSAAARHFDALDILQRDEG